MVINDVSDEGPTSTAPTVALPHCAYCKAGIDRHATTGVRDFIHVLTRGEGGQILKWRPCTRSGEHF